MIQSHRGWFNSLTMSVIIYIKRVHVEHRHLTDRDIYTIVNPLFSFLRCIFFLKMNEILRQQRNRLNLMFLCSRRIDIELTLFVFSPSSPFFHHLSRTFVKKFIKFVTISCGRYRRVIQSLQFSI